MGEEKLDTRLLAELTVESQDLNSDAVRITRQALDEYTQHQQEVAGGPRRSRGGWLAGLAGGAMLLGAGRAAAATASPTPNNNDIMALQTAASIENLAVSVYTTAAGLPFIKDGNATVLAFITKTTDQHKQHAQAFNSALTSAGAKVQNEADPKYAAVVQQALPTIKTPSDVVKLALSLEEVAAQTYTKYVTLASNSSLRTLFGSVAPVEAQHQTVLLSVQALLAANAADLIAIPTDPAKLPAAAGSVGIPVAFYPTTLASPISEGAVQ